MRAHTALAAAVLATVTAVFGTAPPAAAIIGGREATEKYSFMATLHDPEHGHFCGASLIAPQWVVTAGHCTPGVTAGRTMVRIGSTSRLEGGSLTGVASVILHPGYTKTRDPETGDVRITHDMALIKLNRPVTQRPIRLPTRTAEPGGKARVLGWGYTCPPPFTENCPIGSLPTMLRELDHIVIPDSHCARIQGREEVCAEVPHPKAGVCTHDSGGPLARRAGRHWTLAGVTSRTESMLPGCGTGNGRAIWTDVAAYHTWISHYASALEYGSRPSLAAARQ
ncbi:serine protease [Streptosporangium sp. KLBMP 9127]|nr:serine protease [Streptosporangium sp. KLBMP 9127]